MQNFEEILKQTLESLKKSAEFNEIVGKPIVNGDGTIVLPVSKISVVFLPAVQITKAKGKSNLLWE